MAEVNKSPGLINYRINDAFGWDDRKELLEVWQGYVDLPEGSSIDNTYNALLAIARWGARRLIKNELEDDDG